ncbi:unnamed protein product, partial [Amoebophrya sp. A120]
NRFKLRTEKIKFSHTTTSTQHQHQNSANKQNNSFPFSQQQHLHLQHPEIRLKYYRDDMVGKFEFATRMRSISIENLQYETKNVWKFGSGSNSKNFLRIPD